MTGEYEVSDFPDIKEKCVALGVDPPTSLALLPSNIDSVARTDELVHSIEEPTVAKLLAEAGLDAARVRVPGEKPRYQTLHFADWIGPTVFVAASLMSGNPGAVDIALGVIANYVTDILKGATGSATASLDVVVETKRGHKKVHYEGPPAGLSDLPAIIRASLREVSIVEVPQDKRARVMMISDGPDKRDVMTWRKVGGVASAGSGTAPSVPHD